MGGRDSGVGGRITLRMGNAYVLHMDWTHVIQADVDGSGTMTLRELDEWIKSLGITNLTFQDVQFLGNSMDKDHSGFVEVSLHE